MRFEYIAYSEQGRARRKNEDRVMAGNEVISRGCRSGDSESGFLAVVCDGVGGSYGGDVAAEMVAESFIDYSTDGASPILILRHIHKINYAVVSNKNEEKKRAKMATTVAGLVACNNRFLVFNLGDTRVYKISRGKITLLSRDHTLGSYKKWDFMGKGDHVITGYIGGDGNACYPSVRTGNVEDGDFFLICSDGIYRNMDHSFLKEIILKDESMEEKKEDIILSSLEKGSTDDMSMVLIKCSA